MSITGLLVSLLYLSKEKAFYYWDFNYYHEQTVITANTFHQSLTAGMHRIIGSLNDFYNNLFILPLVPFIWIFGPARPIYVSAVYIVYFVPFLLVASALARCILPEHGSAAARIAPIFVLATPTCWIFVVRGYPDIGGAVLVGLMLLLYFRSDGALRYLPLLGTGFLGAMAILLRRHYAYAVVALYPAFGVDAVLHNIFSRNDARNLLKRMLYLALMGLVTVGLVTLVAPGFVRRASSSSFQQSLAGWEDTPWLTLKAFVGTMGLPVLLLGVLGFLALPRITKEGRPQARVLVLASISWLVIWVLIVRQQAYHFPHILPLTVVIGLTSLWIVVGHHGFRAWLIRSVVVGVLALNAFVMLSNSSLAVHLGDWLPRFATADPIRPLVNPAYNEIVRLVAYLRSHAQSDDRVLVGASSPLLNYDLLRTAEMSLYGNQKLRLDFAPQVDSRDSAPVTDLMDAQFVVIAKPFQYHLAPGRQKVVRVLLQVFDGNWKVAEDFQRLPERFTLGQEDTQMIVYQRIRPSTIEVQADTARRMAEYMNQAIDDQVRDRLTVGDVWMKRSSPFPVTIVPHGNSTVDITAHPVRRQESPDTVIEGMADKQGNVTVSANVHFYDGRCPGAEIFAGTNYVPGATGVSVGVFTPSHNDSHFEVKLAKTVGQPIYLDVKSSPNSPRNIDYCALIIGNLQVKPQ